MCTQKTARGDKTCVYIYIFNFEKKIRSRAVSVGRFIFVARHRLLYNCYYLYLSEKKKHSALTVLFGPIKIIITIIIVILIIRGETKKQPIPIIN